MLFNHLIVRSEFIIVNQWQLLHKLGLHDSRIGKPGWELLIMIRNFVNQLSLKIDLYSIQVLSKYMPQVRIQVVELQDIRKLSSLLKVMIYIYLKRMPVEAQAVIADIQQNLPRFVLS